MIRDAIVEPVGEDSAWAMIRCAHCDAKAWLRAIASSDKGAYWGVFCSGCGAMVAERWNLLP